MRATLILSSILVAGCGPGGGQLGTYAGSVSAYVLTGSTTRGQVTVTGPLTVAGGAQPGQLRFSMASCEFTVVKTSDVEFTIPASSGCTIPPGTPVTVDGSTAPLATSCTLTGTQGAGRFRDSMLEFSGGYTGKCGDMPITDQFTGSGTKQ